MKLIDICTRRLDTIHDRLCSGDDPKTHLTDLFDTLLGFRSELDGDEWARFATETAVNHPLRDLIHEDPMTRRSFDKPRGYAGDAVLLDFIYGERTPEDMSEVVRDFHEYALARPAARAVRRRREYITELIDEMATSRRIDVLSIASGHLREADTSRAVREGQVGRFVALDADAKSIEFVGERYPDIEAHPLSVKELIADGDRWGRFDLVYSSGLFDYLQDRMAKRLIEYMFDAIRPGGRLMFTNFLPTVADAGFMESYMGWKLLFRGEAGLEELTSTLPAEQVASRRIWRDIDAAVGYVEVARR